MGLVRLIMEHFGLVKRKEYEIGFVTSEGIFVEPDNRELRSYSLGKILNMFGYERGYNLDCYVRRFYKSEIPPSRKHLLFTSCGGGYLPRFAPDHPVKGTMATFYQDGEYSFVFCADNVGNPLAIVSFNIYPYACPERSTLLKVIQVQGLRGKKDILKGILWAPLMLNLALDFARQTGFDYLGVIGYKDSSWDAVRDDPRYGLIYNGNAKKLGCRWSSKSRCYIKNLNKAK